MVRLNNSTEWNARSELIYKLTFPGASSFNPSKEIRSDGLILS